MIKPMLAKRFHEQKRKITYPCHIQPKLDGVRALISDGIAQTRNGVLWGAGLLTHLTQVSKTLIPPNLILDGELYLHGVPRQTLIGALNPERLNPTEMTSRMQYHVFDVIDTDNLDMPFSERSSRLLELLSYVNSEFFVFVPTHIVTTEAETDAWYKHFKNNDYEGIMYRQSAAPYGLLHNCGNKDNRWDVLLKRKGFEDQEFECIDVEVGQGKYTTMAGALVFQTKDGLIFTVGSGLTDLQRQEFMDRPPIGQMVTIRFEQLSEDKIPLQPRIKAVHSNNTIL